MASHRSPFHLSFGVTLLLVVGLTAATPRAQTGPLFGAPTAYATGSGTGAVAVGDVDADGLLDVVAANKNTNDVSVLLGQGGGALGAASSFAAGPTPRAVALGDLDGDGLLDVAVANNATNEVRVLLNLGVGTLGPPAAYTVGSGPGGPIAIAIGELNGDGLLDLAVANQGVFFPPSGSVSILLGAGGGLFNSASTWSAGIIPMDLVLGDVDADGNLDLITCHGIDGTLHVGLGQGDGTFAVSLFGGGGRTLALGDVGADGPLDAVVGLWSTSGLVVVPGAGDGSFAAGMGYEIGSEAWDVASGDLNADGRADAVAARYFHDSVSVQFGQLNGVLSAPTFYPSGARPTALALGDLDGDGRPDLVVASEIANTVSVLQNLGPGDPWTDLGFAMGLGPFEQVPVLQGSGTLLPGSAGTLDLTEAEPNAPALLLIALTITPTPFHCGVILAVPAVRELPAFTSAAGTILTGWSIWPASLSGFELYLQWIVLDPGASCGVAYSNAVKAAVP